MFCSRESTSCLMIQQNEKSMQNEIFQFGSDQEAFDAIASFKVHLYSMFSLSFYTNTSDHSVENYEGQHFPQTCGSHVGKLVKACLLLKYFFLFLEKIELDSTSKMIQNRMRNIHLHNVNCLYPRLLCYCNNTRE